jgi:hypothetical protein
MAVTGSGAFLTAYRGWWIRGSLVLSARCLGRCRAPPRRSVCCSLSSSAATASLVSKWSRYLEGVGRSICVRILEWMIDRGCFHRMEEVKDKR